MKITEFKLTDSLGNYDKSKNIDRLSVYNLLPDGISWIYNGENHHSTNNNKIISILLKGEEEIGVVESPFNYKMNKAYIINGDGQIKWNVVDLIKIKYKNLFINKHIIISDLYYISNYLYFSIIIDNMDYRFSFNSINGDIGQLIESR